VISGHRLSRCLVSPFLALLATFCGCVSSEPAVNTAETRDRIIYVQGAMGFLHYGDDSLRLAVKDAQSPTEVVTFAWHEDFKRPPLYVVTNRAEYEIYLLAAQTLADDIIAFKTRKPDVRISLASLSAGAEIIRLALELLPDYVTVQNVVLINPSSSPGIPLRKALRAVDGKLYCVCSRLDLILSGGTIVVGTTDRRHVPAAGLVGFHLPGDADDDLARLYYDKVVNVFWRPEFALYGFVGGHFSGLAPPFVKAFVLPMLESRYSPRDEPPPPTETDDVL